MARIRSVKPDFWDSPSTALASLRGRLFYIAMWNWADDWGVGDGNPRRLLSFAFPNDESSEVEPRNFRRLASEVAECFGVVWYEVEGRPYYQIPTWEEHQRTEKKAKRANPPSDQAERILYSENAEVPTPSGGFIDDGRGKGEVGKGSGKGEELPAASPPSARASSLPPDWSPTKEHHDRAHEDGTDVDREAVKFRSHAAEKGRTAKNWNAAFTRWLMQAADYAKRDAGKPARSMDRQGDLLREEMARARAADAAHEGRLEIEGV